ncbi:hypothetical protein D3C86_1528180 [compost metagenome]
MPHAVEDAGRSVSAGPAASIPTMDSVTAQPAKKYARIRDHQMVMTRSYKRLRMTPSSIRANCSLKRNFSRSRRGRRSATWDTIASTMPAHTCSVVSYCHALNQTVHSRCLPSVRGVESALTEKSSLPSRRRKTLPSLRCGNPAEPMIGLCLSLSIRGSRFSRISCISDDFPAPQGA